MRISQISSAVWAGLVGLSLTAPAMAKELPAEFAKRESVIKLQPTAPWNIHFADNRCVLSRVFGEGDNQHLIFFEQASPTHRFGMTLAGPKVKRFAAGRWNYLGILSDVPMKPFSGVKRGEVAQVGPALIVGSVFIGQAEQDNKILAGVNLEQAAKIDRIVLKLGTSGLSFETGNMKPAMQALNVCTSDLLETWGLDPDKHQAYSPPEWLNSDNVVAKIRRDYPSAAERRGEQAIFRMRVIVELDGTVSDCRLEKSTETESLESNACAEMQKARFKPAQDANGKPMRSFFANTISYQIG